MPDIRPGFEDILKQIPSGGQQQVQQAANAAQTADGSHIDQPFITAPKWATGSIKASQMLGQGAAALAKPVVQAAGFAEEDPSGFAGAVSQGIQEAGYGGYTLLRSISTDLLGITDSSKTQAIQQGLDAQRAEGAASAGPNAAGYNAAANISKVGTELVSGGLVSKGVGSLLGPLATGQAGFSVGNLLKGVLPNAVGTGVTMAMDAPVGEKAKAFGAGAALGTALSAVPAVIGALPTKSIINDPAIGKISSDLARGVNKTDLDIKYAQSKAAAEAAQLKDPTGDISLHDTIKNVFNAAKQGFQDKNVKAFSVFDELKQAGNFSTSPLLKSESITAMMQKAQEGTASGPIKKYLTELSSFVEKHPSANLAQIRDWQKDIGESIIKPSLTKYQKSLLGDAQGEITTYIKDQASQLKLKDGVNAKVAIEDAYNYWKQSGAVTGKSLDTIATELSKGNIREGMILFNNSTGQKKLVEHIQRALGPEGSEVFGRALTSDIFERSTMGSGYNIVKITNDLQKVINSPAYKLIPADVKKLVYEKSSDGVTPFFWIMDQLKQKYGNYGGLEGAVEFSKNAAQKAFSETVPGGEMVVQVGRAILNTAPGISIATKLAFEKPGSLVAQRAVNELAKFGVLMKDEPGPHGELPVAAPKDQDSIRPGFEAMLQKVPAPTPQGGQK